MKKIYGVLLMFVLVLSGCGTSETSYSNKMQVMTTVKPITDIVAYVGGDDVEVNSVYPEGSDAHHYELTSKDMKRVSDADMFIYVANSNSNFAEDLQDSGNYNAKFVNVSEEPAFKDNVDSSLYGTDVEEHDHEEEGQEDEEHADEVMLEDPHVWLSPKKLVLMNNAITQQLITANPDHEADYKKRSEELNKQFNDLDKQFTEFAKNQKYPIIVAHDAYSYWVKDYGIDGTGAYGKVHEDEPTAKEIQGFIDEVKSKKIPVVYVEQNDQDNKVIKQIAEQTGAKVETLDNIASQGVNDERTTVEILQADLDALKVLEK